MISLVVAQENEQVRRAVVDDLIGDEPEIEIVGQAETGPEALALVRAHNPDVLVTDLPLPGQTGLEVLSQITKEDRPTRVIVCSAYYSDTYVLMAFQQGAFGYVLKALANEMLVKAIRAVASGERIFYHDFPSQPLDEYLAKGREKHTRLFEALTNREREVLFLSSQALDRTTLADRLCISMRTVDKHMQNLRKKLGLHSRAELMTFGFQEGLVPLPYVAPA